MVPRRDRLQLALLRAPPCRGAPPPLPAAGPANRPLRPRPAPTPERCRPPPRPGPAEPFAARDGKRPAPG